MRPVAASNRAVEYRRRNRPSVPPAAGDGKPEAPSRALVPLAPSLPVPDNRAALVRPSAAFLAQLIAAKRNLPQARERRRAEPHEAIAAYTAASRAA